MQAGYQNLKLTKGRTFAFSLTYCQGDGEPYNLAGYKALMQVRRKPARDARLVLEFSTDNGRIQIPEPAKGEIRLGILPSETHDLLEGDWYYDLVLYGSTPAAIESGGSSGIAGVDKTVIPILTGRFSVKSGVTEIPDERPEPPVTLPETF